MQKYYFTSESVTEGHPDKLCDQISDSILDEILRSDPNGRVAVECLAKTGFVVIAGEVTTNAKVDYQKVARETIKKIGYDKSEYGFHFENCAILLSLSEQSQDIAVGVNTLNDKEQGAGDQGIMFGYACNETKELLPLPISLAHKLAKQLSSVRKKKEINWLRPDGKTQVTVEYVDGVPKRIDSIVVSTQHDPDVTHEEIKREIVEKVISPICKTLTDEKTKYFINPTGIFVVGGPQADAGLTGRKIIVDTYGGAGHHGGGAFSGKDPSKVDRSAAYMARYIAKNIVAAKIADRCEVQLSYAIGVAEPISVYVNSFGTGKISDDKISEAVKKHFALKPADIIKQLDLKKPIYAKTAAYGHFGREDEGFTWEKLDKVDELKKELV